MSETTFTFLKNISHRLIEKISIESKDRRNWFYFFRMRPFSSEFFALSISI